MDELIERLQKAHKLIWRTNVKEHVEESLRKVVEEAEFYANAATGKREQRSKARQPQEHSFSVFGD